MADAQIDELFRAGQAAWPTIALDPAVFRRRMEGRGGEGLRGEDLYLACACLEHDRAALSIFEESYLRPVGATLKKSGLTSAVADETLGVLRQKLLVAEPGLLPKLAGYAGRGDLRGWLEVVASRQALRLTGTREVSGECALESIADGAEDIELRVAKGQRQGEFREAFADALRTLTPRERNLLRQRYLDAVGWDEIAALYGVHKATVQRWLGRAERALFVRTKKALMSRLRLDPREVESLVADAQSRLDVSLRRLLR